MLVKTKLQLNALIVAIGLFILGVTTYSSFSDLEEEYHHANKIATKTTYLKSMVIGGLLYNSSSGVYENDPSQKKALKTMSLGVSKMDSFAQKLKKIDKKHYEQVKPQVDTFLTIANSKIQKANSGEFLTKKDLKESLKVWRGIKLKLFANIKELNKESLQSQEAYKESLTFAISEALVIITVIIVLIAIINLIISKSILTPLDILNKATEDLNDQTSKASRVKISNDDEIGKISHNINNYIDGKEKQHHEDDLFIQDIQKVMARVANGWFSQYIEKQTENPNLIRLKETVNSALTNLKDRFTEMNHTLEEYVNLDYRKKLQINGVEPDGVFDTLIKDINELRNAITLMLVDNKQKGLNLDYSSDIFLENVDLLNKNVNEAAAALEETAAALEEITSNIKQNTQNVINMSKFASEVTRSADEGQQLASKTAHSMDDINNEVMAIKEAITVIDQIAFQTNILSLNAAVEAATAGESGKGFAVVAQEVRNLASRSADAANEIKTLVENATSKANNGKGIASKMIEGYNGLNENITKTIDLIKNVETASQEQQAGIMQINDAINALDRQTQQNASVATQTHEIAFETDEISKLILKSADEKQFEGKDAIKVEKTDKLVEKKDTTEVEATYVKDT
jgi:methyl-accepting chemotaxis protein